MLSKTNEQALEQTIEKYLTGTCQEELKEMAAEISLCSPGVCVTFIMITFVLCVNFLIFCYFLIPIFIHSLLYAFNFIFFTFLIFFSYSVTLYSVIHTSLFAPLF